MMPGRSLLWMCALGLGACAAAPGPGPGTAAAASSAPLSLVGTRWAGVVDPGTDSRVVPRLEFAQDRVNGFTGCNLLSGSWRAEGGEARFGPIVTTRRFCVGAPGDIEKRLLAAVSDGGGLRREGPRLVAVGPGGERFEFTEVPA